MASSLNTIVAGVDFGTTKTCVSYCFRNGGRSSNPTIHSWTPTGCTENIIPSVVSYTPGGSCLYGPEVSPQMKSLVWQKLLMEGPGERKAFNPAGVERAFLDEIVSSEASQLAGGREPVKIISDFLKRLYTEFFAFLVGQSFGSAVPPIQFWFTLPATWSNPTRMRMLDAINGAGFLSRDLDTIYFVTEAESAASYYVHTHPSSFKPGDIVVVCDAGGGTTDFAAFSIQRANPSLACQQLASTAVRCGASDVDHNLYNLLCRGLGLSVNELNEGLRGPTGKLMRVIRRDKDKFERDPVTVPLQTVARNANPAVYDRKRSRFTFHPHDVHGAYKPVINAVLGILLQELNRIAISNSSTIKILLTGGLTKAFHVQEEMKNFLVRQGLAHSICPVTEAVAHGAVWRGLFGGLSQSPKSPRHFGLVSRELPPLYPAERQPLHVPPIVVRPVWFLPKDQGFSVPHQGGLTVKVCHGEKDSDIVKIAICECDGFGDPPARLDGLSCRTNRYVTLNFTGADLEYFRHQKVGDEVFYCLEIKIVWTIPAGDGWMTLHAFALGRQIGAEEICMQSGF